MTLVGNTMFWEKLNRTGERVQNLAWALSIDDGLLVRRRGLSAKTVARLRGMATRHIGTPELVVDVGAHRGGFLRIAAAAFPRVASHSFEPLPEAYAELVACAAKLSSPSATRCCHNMAVGDEVGEVAMTVAEFEPASSVFSSSALLWHDFPQTERVARQTKVDVTTLDLWASQFEVKAEAMVVKADVQGSEAAVIRGAERLLRERRVLLIAEVSLRPLYEGAPTAGDVMRLAEEFGYFPVDILESLRGPASGDLVQADIVFAAVN